MPASRKRRQAPEYYIEGNTVRKLDAWPQEAPERRQREAAEAKRREAERRKRQQIARRNQEKAQRLNLTYTLFLIASVVITVAACVHYLSLQNQIMGTGEQVAALKSELSTLTNENVAMEERINGAVDLAEVYQTAVGEFGMTAITAEQIHYYSNNNQDYVRQYGQIPTED